MNTTSLQLTVVLFLPLLLAGVDGLDEGEEDMAEMVAGLLDALLAEPTL